MSPRTYQKWIAVWYAFWKLCAHRSEICRPPCESRSRSRVGSAQNMCDCAQVTLSSCCTEMRELFNSSFTVSYSANLGPHAYPGEGLTTSSWIFDDNMSCFGDPGSHLVRWSKGQHPLCLSHVKIAPQSVQMILRIQKYDTHCLRDSTSYTIYTHSVPYSHNCLLTVNIRRCSV